MIALCNCTMFIWRIQDFAQASMFHLVIPDIALKALMLYGQVSIIVATIDVLVRIECN